MLVGGLEDDEDLKIGECWWMGIPCAGMVHFSAAWPR